MPEGDRIPQGTRIDSQTSQMPEQIEFLGHVVGSGKVAVPEMRVTAMSEQC